MKTVTSPRIGERAFQRKDRARVASPGRIKDQASLHCFVFAFFLILGTFVLYYPVHGHSFLIYDDYGYVVNNHHVTAGLTWQMVRWSLTSTEQANWHPITWLSHALDCQLFGLDAGRHHLVNVVLHIVNVLVLFLILQKATAAVGRSFVVAALFAWHPFNVQSVAWVAERKNILSTLFFLLALGAYGWYAQRPKVKRFVPVVALFLLGLASKPMLVTFPFVLLLMDYWPLGRVQGSSWRSSVLRIPPQPVRRLILEKLPLLALAAASCAITVWAQKTGGALQTLQGFPFGLRLENALCSYLMYLCKGFWPSQFSVFYPFSEASIPLRALVLSALVLCAVSAVAWRQRSDRPFLLVGWLWFLGTLVPVIGIVQVGDQAMADRYAYLPLVGIFIMVVWSAADFLDTRHLVGTPRWALASLVLGALLYLTFQQLGYWENDITIWSHALKVTGDDLAVERKFGNTLVLLGDPDGALPHLIKAARSDPEDVIMREDLGVCFLAEGRTQEALQEFESVAKLTEDHHADARDREFWEFRSSALVNLGIAYTLSEDYSGALRSFQRAYSADKATVEGVAARLEQAITSAPAESDFVTLSLLRRAAGKEIEASQLLEQALSANPDYRATRQLLSYYAQPR